MDQSKKTSITTILLDEAYNNFLEVKLDQVKGNRKNPIRLVDCLMSALAMFGLKFPSLLQFDQYVQFQKNVIHNLVSLYKINTVPSDTYMRERLDEVDPREIRKTFKTIFSFIQRRGILEDFQFIDGYYLLPFDGTGIFSSKDIYCTSCCKKEHRDGTTTYYHQILAAAIVHPKLKQVIPLAPEPIDKKDGTSKNDCEFNAVLRFMDDFRNEHPHLKIIATGDGLFSKGPIIRKLKSSNMRYIIGAKPGDHRNLFDFVKPILKKHVYKALDGTVSEYYYVNNVPLNDANSDLEVNFFEYHETSPKGKMLKFSWVTDIVITETNVHQIMQGGRARWKIENETFNTLKNQNYHFEHNFGHGKKNLNNVFAMLLLLAFLIDQVQEICDTLFKKALLRLGRKSYLWEQLRGLFTLYKITSWSDIWLSLGTDFEGALLTSNSS